MLSYIQCQTDEGLFGDRDPGTNYQHSGTNNLKQNYFNLVHYDLLCNLCFAFRTSVKKCSLKRVGKLIMVVKSKWLKLSWCSDLNNYFSKYLSLFLSNKQAMFFTNILMQHNTVWDCWNWTVLLLTQTENVTLQLTRLYQTAQAGDASIQVSQTGSYKLVLNCVNINTVTTWNPAKSWD